jgi:two-component system, cell cycle response regulator DivK
VSTVLIIEDNINNARLAAKLLRAAGHDVLLAEDGETGLSAVFSAPPNLVLVDLGLPDLDGQTVAALIRQQPATAHIPLIAFTAWPEDAAHSMAQAYGCDGVITKPINTRTFVSQINNFLEASRVEE